MKSSIVERLKPRIKNAYACDLLDKLLTLDPSQRIDAVAALNHDFFWTDPVPSDLSTMLNRYNHSMFELLSRRDSQTRKLRSGSSRKKLKPPADDSYYDPVF